jgi:dTDP-4-dehydrorhamnose 3,5-epimerase
VKFTETAIPGAFVVDPDPALDERGFFARLWCSRELSSRGLVGRCAQASLSFNKERGTLRGMHYQVPPYVETKLVVCNRGSIYDVLIDLRPGPTRLIWVSVELSSTNRRMLYVPDGVAHGFLTLEDETEVLYFISEFFEPTAARGVRYNDPTFGIRWPNSPSVISMRDATFPDFSP